MQYLQRPRAGGLGSKQAALRRKFARHTSKGHAKARMLEAELMKVRRQLSALYRPYHRKLKKLQGKRRNR